MATKLHQLLAVHNNLQGQATKTLTDIKALFTNKRHHFEKKLKTVTYSGENAATETVEQSDIQTTVKQEIEWLNGHLAKAMDAGYHIDLANMEAKADIVDEDGKIVAKEIPATSLLWLEKRLKEVQTMISAIPTLDPSKGFSFDEASGQYQAREVIKDKTRKEKEVITLVPPSEKHPGQAQLVDVDKVIGKFHEQEWSSLITPAIKADLLDKCEKLYRAVTKARSKANEQEVNDTAKIGKQLLEYVFAPLSAQKVG